MTIDMSQANPTAAHS